MLDVYVNKLYVACLMCAVCLQRAHLYKKMFFYLLAHEIWWNGLLTVFLFPSIHVVFFIQSSTLAIKNHPHPHSTLWCKLRGLGENTVEGICVRFIPLESWHQHPANKETEASTIRGVFSTRPAPSIGATNVTSCSTMSSRKIFCYQFLWALLLPLWPPVVIGQWLQCGIIFMGIPTKSSSCHNDKYTYVCKKAQQNEFDAYVYIYIDR